MRNVLNGVWVLLAAISLAGCADYIRMSRLADDSVDARSPNAAAISAANRARYPYPNLRELPAHPSDLRPLPAYAAEAQALAGDRAALIAWRETHPATPSDPDGFAARARGGVLDPALAAPPADQARRSEAWAEQARKAAAPPPPPGGG